MIISFTPSGWQDCLWLQQHDRKMLLRLNKLLVESTRTPFHGTGKPEPLKGDLSGYWSRRIDDANRLVYSVTDERLLIVACRHHYTD